MTRETKLGLGIAGTFLMLSYFGCDQSQVQRYLTARSVEEGQTSLLMSAYWKIPLQALSELIRESYRLVYERLPLRMRRGFEGAPAPGKSPRPKRPRAR